MQEFEKIRRLGDLNYIDDVSEDSSVSQNIVNPYVLSVLDTHSKKYNVYATREYGNLPKLRPHDYSLDRPITFSNNILVAFQEYKDMRKRSEAMLMDEIKQAQKAKTSAFLLGTPSIEEVDPVPVTIIPEPPSIHDMADKVAQDTVNAVFPDTESRIRIIGPNDVNKDILAHYQAEVDAIHQLDIEDGLAIKNKDSDIQQPTPFNSLSENELWMEFRTIFEEAKILEGIQYVQDLTGQDLHEVLDEINQQNIRSTLKQQQSRTQLNIDIPPQWASKSIKDIAKSILRRKTLESGNIPDLLPFDHKIDNISILQEIETEQDDELLTQEALLGASQASNSLDYIKDKTIIDALDPYITYESNVLIALHKAHNIMLKEIYEKQIKIIQELRSHQKQLSVDAARLRQFDQDTLDRFDRMIIMHNELLHGIAHGANQRSSLYLQYRDNLIKLYLEWLYSDDAEHQAWMTSLPEHIMSTEVKSLSVYKDAQEHYNSIITRDANARVQKAKYLSTTEDWRQELVKDASTALFKARARIVDIIECEFDKFTLLLDEINRADREFGLYVDKIHDIKNEWDRYSLLSKAAVIKALVIKHNRPTEADEILESTNTAVLNMDYLKKVMHVIGSDMNNVSDVAHKRIHNMYCLFDPTLHPYQMSSSDYPIPEAYILSQNIVIPQQNYNPDHPNNMMSIQDKIEQDMLAEEMERFQPGSAIGLMDEEYEDFEDVEFEDRIPYRRGVEGTGIFKKIYKDFIDITGVASLDRADALSIQYSTSSPDPLVYRKVQAELYNTYIVYKGMINPNSSIIYDSMIQQQHQQSRPSSSQQQQQYQPEQDKAVSIGQYIINSCSNIFSRFMKNTTHDRHTTPKSTLSSSSLTSPSLPSSLPSVPYSLLWHNTIPQRHYQDY